MIRERERERESLCPLAVIIFILSVILVPLNNTYAVECANNPSITTCAGYHELISTPEALVTQSFEITISPQIPPYIYRAEIPQRFTYIITEGGSIYTTTQGYEIAINPYLPPYIEGDAGTPERILVVIGGHDFSWGGNAAQWYKVMVEGLYSLAVDPLLINIASTPNSLSSDFIIATVTSPLDGYNLILSADSKDLICESDAISTIPSTSSTGVLASGTWGAIGSNNAQTPSIFAPVTTGDGSVIGTSSTGGPTDFEHYIHFGVKPSMTNKICTYGSEITMTLMPNN
ncbi:hypothetical protein FACS1894191_6850 [Clostridia bacterium]|nr:hypothetical protein FACS1894191_6850 [Clostridia bacterium]